MFQMSHLCVIENSCVKIVRNPSKIVEVMVLTNSDRRMQARMHAHTPNYHCDNYVLLTAGGLNKNGLNTVTDDKKVCVRPKLKASANDK